MQRPYILAAGIVLSLAGCHTPAKTDAWRKVVDIRKQAGDSGDRSSAYAADVHAVLKEARIEHKVVTFEYQWTSRYSGDQSAQRTVVLYRDPQTPKHQWWLADEPLRTPVWLPDASIERQVAFYVRRPATVVETRDFGTDAKEVKPLEKPHRKTATTRIEPPAKPAPKPKAEAVEQTERKTPETSIKKSGTSPVPPAKLKPAGVANPTPVPTAKPLLIDEPGPAPRSFDQDTLSEPKPFPKKPAFRTNPTPPSADARPNFLQRIFSALTVAN